MIRDRAEFDQSKMTPLYNFDEIIDRSATASNKWDKYQGRDILPMWVADTDFRAAPAITEAIKQRADHAVFGYTHVSERQLELVVERMQRLYQWAIKPEWILFYPGVVSALHLASRSFGCPGDEIYTPEVVYQHIPEIADFNGRVLRRIPMLEAEQRIIMDADWLAGQSIKPRQIMVLCNPQNPGGSVYNEAELQRVAEVAEAQDLIVCSDDIHCDLILDEDKRHIPIASLNDDIARRSITLMGPSKSFNLAGLGCSFAIVPDASIRKQLVNAAKGTMPWVNIMGYTALQAAYESGGEWLTQQLRYLAGNRDILSEKINQIPGMALGPTEATYLAWIDVSELELDDPLGFFENAGVGMSGGAQFGDNRFMRLNFGCPRSRVEAAIERLGNAAQQAG
ncbi:MAG: cystathionine beta-lyase [Planctomycetota bacterium]|jgi:cystathionine beta-lyase